MTTKAEQLAAETADYLADSMSFKGDYKPELRAATGGGGRNDRALLDREARVINPREDVFPTQISLAPTLTKKPLSSLLTVSKRMGFSSPFEFAGVKMTTGGCLSMVSAVGGQASSQARPQSSALSSSRTSPTMSFSSGKLVENTIRENLNPIEEATAYQQLLEKRSWSKAQLAERIKMHRTTISRTIALLVLASQRSRKDCPLVKYHRVQVGR